MDISPNELRRETLATLRQVKEQIEEVELVASRDTHYGRKKKAHELRDHNGQFVLPPLLQTKAQCLNTLALLRGQ